MMSEMLKIGDKVRLRLKNNARVTASVTADSDGRYVLTYYALGLRRDVNAVRDGEGGWLDVRKGSKLELVAP